MVTFHSKPLNPLIATVEIQELAGKTIRIGDLQAHCSRVRSVSGVGPV